MFFLLKIVRIPECLMVVLLGLISFKHTSFPIHSLSLLTLFFVVASTMLQNGWRDRFHDIGKGKSLAYENQSLLLFWLITFWIICVILIGTLYMQNPVTGYLFIVMAFVGAIYSEARKIPFLSVILVTLAVTSSLFIPVTLGASLADMYMLLIAVALIMFGRETLHDIADTKADFGYKKTVPILLGDKFARIICAFSLIIGSLFAITISTISILGSLLVLWGMMNIFMDVDLKSVRRKVDIGLVLLTLGLFI